MARNPASLWLHSMLRKKSKISNYKSAIRKELWEDFTSLQPQIWQTSSNHYMHFPSKCSKKRYPGTTMKRNSLYKNQHFQSHFASITMGPIKHKTKLGLRHMQLWELEQPVPPQLSPDPAMIWVCIERLQSFLVLKMDDSRCAFQFCTWSFYFQLSHLPVTGACNEKLWKLLPTAALHMKLQFHVYKCLFPQSWNSKFMWTLN